MTCGCTLLRNKNIGYTIGINQRPKVAKFGCCDGVGGGGVERAGEFLIVVRM